ncbi:hypothetical protein L0Y49_04025 [bacterium]|nr:hypothetical protein [bacterium]MCI0566010.1 hypothetical protein [bacterium]MCI0680343.1 hypothetical protein [bacterium]
MEYFVLIFTPLLLFAFPSYIQETILQSVAGRKDTPVIAYVKYGLLSLALILASVMTDVFELGLFEKFLAFGFVFMITTAMTRHRFFSPQVKKRPKTEGYSSGLR